MFFNKKPLISGASVKWEGQITIYNYLDSPCYRCLYPECPKSNQMMSCNNDGVIGIAPNITGNILAMQCLKLIINSSELLVKKLLIFDLLNDDFKVVKLRSKKKEFYK